MSRRHRAEKREILPDPKFSDLVLGKFMNVLMIQGKKSVAETIIYGALDKMKATLKTATETPIELFHKALNNVRPYLEVRSRRVGGATYQVPVDVRPDRSLALAMRWTAMSIPFIKKGSCKCAKSGLKKLFAAS
jgi:small subunit ribosomal protein S7